MIQYIAGHTYQIIDFFVLLGSSCSICSAEMYFFLQKGPERWTFLQELEAEAVACCTGHGHVDGILLKLLRTLMGFPLLNSTFECL